MAEDFVEVLRVPVGDPLAGELGRPVLVDGERLFRLLRRAHRVIVAVVIAVIVRVRSHREHRSAVRTSTD